MKILIMLSTAKLTPPCINKTKINKTKDSLIHHSFNTINIKYK